MFSLSLSLFCLCIIFMITVINHSQANLPYKLSPRLAVSPSWKDKREIKASRKHFRLGTYFFQTEKLFFIHLGLTLFISFLAYFLFSRVITSGIYALMLTALISIAFKFRSLSFFTKQFQSKLSNEIQSITFSMQTQLAKGLTLDQACKTVFILNSTEILQKDIELFIQAHASNINKKLPEFYLALSHKYKTPYLALAAQILDLELQFSQNQAAAFEAAYDYFSIYDKNQKKLKNTTGIIFLTMDCMLVIYLIIIFGILPSLNLGTNSWWESNSRPFEMFISSSLFWLAYLVSVLLINKKESELL